MMSTARFVGGGGDVLSLGGIGDGVVVSTGDIGASVWMMVVIAVLLLLRCHYSYCWWC